MLRLFIRKFNASEIKHVAHSEGVAGKCVDDEPAEAVEGAAVPALHIQHGSGPGICEAVMFTAGKVESRKGHGTAKVHLLFDMQKITEFLLEIMPVVEHVLQARKLLYILEPGFI